MIGLSRRRLIFLPLVLCACQSWRTVPLAPKDSGALPDHVWVVRLGGERVPVERGRVTTDSLIGRGGGGGRFAVSRDSIAFVEERRVSALRTLGLIGGIYGAAAVVSALLFIALLSSQY